MRERRWRRFSRPRSLTDGHHAVQRNLCPVLLIVRHNDMVHDVAVGKVFHCPAEMGSIDPEHRRALADCGGEEEDFLIGQIALQSIDQIQFSSNRPNRPGWRRRHSLNNELRRPRQIRPLTTSS